ncbi:MAG TPA: queuosine precursor transporter [Thermoanaerobaculia bacterium]
MDLRNRKDLVYLILAGLFVCNAILGEVLGGKLIAVGPYIMSIGVIPWPVVFLTTDLMNEYFGRPGVRRLTWLTVGLILYAFVVIFAAMSVPAASVSPVNDTAFSMVFGQSLWIIVGSVVAFTISQLLDVFIFWVFRDKTKGRHLWLRATGSTAFSQLVDTFVILGIAFYLPGKIGGGDYVRLSLTNYTYKLGIAIALTPVIYAAHNAIDRYLGHRQAHDLIEEAVEKSHARSLSP